MDLSKTTPDTALKLKPGFELDVFIYRYVFDGVLEVVSSARGQQFERPIPSFSRRADSAKALMIKMMMEHPGSQLVVSLGHVELGRGKKAGHIPEDAYWAAWQVQLDGLSGYGRSYEEAISKLAIELRRRNGQ